MTTFLAPAPSVPHPIIDRLRGLVCVLKPRPRPAGDHPRLALEYRCPEPTSRWFRCRRPLPCTSHAIATPADAFTRHGHVSAKIIAGRA